jgi:hypothetical protein
MHVFWWAECKGGEGKGAVAKEEGRWRWSGSMNGWKDLGEMGTGKTEKKMGRKRDLVIQNRIGGGERKERVSRKEGGEGKGTGGEGRFPVNPKSCSTCHHMLSEQ